MARAANGAAGARLRRNRCRRAVDSDRGTPGNVRLLRAQPAPGSADAALGHAAPLTVPPWGGDERRPGGRGERRARPAPGSAPLAVPPPPLRQGPAFRQSPRRRAPRIGSAMPSAGPCVGALGWTGSDRAGVPRARPTGCRNAGAVNAAQDHEKILFIYSFPKISCKVSIASRVRIFSWSRGRGPCAVPRNITAPGPVLAQ